MSYVYTNLKPFLQRSFVYNCRKPIELSDPVIEFHCGKKNLPIFVRQKKHMSTAQIVETLLDPELDSHRICTSQTIGAENNLVFIVDLQRLEHPKDILCDELGSWKCNGCHHTWVIVNDYGIAEICGKKRPLDGCGAKYRVLKKYYNHKGSSDFHRMVVFIEGMLLLVS